MCKKIYHMAHGQRMLLIAVVSIGLMLPTAKGGDLTINSGAKLVISGDVVVDGNVNIDDASELVLSGSLIVSGNLNNSGTYTNNGGSIEFDGSSMQVLNGIDSLSSLTVNSTGGCDVQSNVYIENELTFTQGRVNLDGTNLTLGPSATVSGTPSSTEMVAIQNGGQMVKEFDAPGSFTYPVGTYDLTDYEYSPVTATFNTGTFGADAALAVSVAPDSTDYEIITPQLERNWTLTQTNISDFSADVVFTYVDADIHGDETQYIGLKDDNGTFVDLGAADFANNQFSGTGLNSFSVFTAGVLVGKFLDVTAILEGPWNGTDMDIDLNTNSYLPLAQPYNIAPWNYAGTEAVSDYSVFTNNDIVDWVYIQLRDADAPENATSATIIYEAAMLLDKDGRLYDVDGSSDPRFTSIVSQNLYVVVYHRNHLGVISNFGANLTGSIYSYNFATGENQAFGGANGHKDMGSGIWGMIGGDADGNGQIQNIDLNNYWLLDNGLSGYQPSDFDLNAQVQNIDLNNYWLPNNGSGNQTPSSPVGSDGEESGYKSQIPE